jgi:diacylglycerol kinase (ATP)
MLEAFRHIVHAAGYSMAGLRYLVRSEMAARIEIVASLLAVIWLVVLGCSLGEIVILLVLFCILMSVEALNTAIEVIADHLSPGRSDFAKAAKDLGSLAVFCLLCAGGLYVLTMTAVKLGLVSLW